LGSAGCVTDHWGQEARVSHGREPNGDRLGLDAAEIDLDDDGRLKIDDYYQTSIPGIWSFGDLSNLWGPFIRSVP
jgi:mycothione reductase